MNQCSICQATVNAWLPHPRRAQRSEFMKLMGAVGSDLSVYQCPACGCNDRDRHLWLYMNAVGLPAKIRSARVLHIAPEAHIESLISKLDPLEYIRGDLHPTREQHAQINVEQLPFEAEHFDLIICNHVLEHVNNPSAALSEFYRCMTPGAVLIAQTPFAPTLKRTLEMTSPISADFARLFYGQDDHVRLFGADIVDCFHAAGLRGEPLAHHVVLGALDAHVHGCNPHEPFFAFSK